MTEFSHTTGQRFGVPPTWDVIIPVSGAGDQHVGIMQNFTDAILDGVPLIAPAAEGIYSVELANAMLYSSLKEKTIDLPLSARTYARELRRLIAQSKPRKKTPRQTAKKRSAKSRK